MRKVLIFTVVFVTLLVGNVYADEQSMVDEVFQAHEADVWFKYEREGDEMYAFLKFSDHFDKLGVNVVGGKVISVHTNNHTTSKDKVYFYEYDEKFTALQGRSYSYINHSSGFTIDAILGSSVDVYNKSDWSTVFFSPVLPLAETMKTQQKTLMEVILPIVLPMMIMTVGSVAFFKGWTFLKTFLLKK